MEDSCFQPNRTDNTLLSRRVTLPFRPDSPRLPTVLQPVEEAEDCTRSPRLGRTPTRSSLRRPTFPVLRPLIMKSRTCLTITSEDTSRSTSSTNSTSFGVTRLDALSLSSPSILLRPISSPHAPCPTFCTKSPHLPVFTFRMYRSCLQLVRSKTLSISPSSSLPFPPHQLMSPSTITPLAFFPSQHSTFSHPSHTLQ